MLQSFVRFRIMYLFLCDSLIMLLVAVVATGDYHILKCDVSDDLFLLATMVAADSKNTTTN